MVEVEPGDQQLINDSRRVEEAGHGSDEQQVRCWGVTGLVEQLCGDLKPVGGDRGREKKAEQNPTSQVPPEKYKWNDT